MTHIGTEKLPLFADGPILPGPPIHDLGETLKEQALQGHAERRAHDIAKVRVALLAGAKLAQSNTLTADDAAVVVERLGLNTGAWCGSIFRNWPAVEHTGQYVKSTIPRSRARMVSVWRVK